MSAHRCDALRALGDILDQESNGAYRLQAINALTYVGEHARAVLPSIRHATSEDHRHVRGAAEYLLAVLEGKYDPRAGHFGGVNNPWTEDWDSRYARP